MFKILYICYDSITIFTELKNLEVEQWDAWINSSFSLFDYSVLCLSF